MEIEKNIEMPKNGHSGNRKKYPYDQMQVGDSFAVSYSDRDVSRLQNNLASTARSYGVRHNKKFATRVMLDEGAVRVWRVE